MFEDDAQRPPATQVIVGEPLTALSIGDLEHRITVLREEIARVEAELGSKKQAGAAAEAVFGRG